MVIVTLVGSDQRTTTGTINAAEFQDLPNAIVVDYGTRQSVYLRSVSMQNQYVETESLTVPAASVTPV
jgi:hypothetical protein